MLWLIGNKMGTSQAGAIDKAKKTDIKCGNTFAKPKRPKRRAGCTLARATDALKKGDHLGFFNILPVGKYKKNEGFNLVQSKKF